MNFANMKQFLFSSNIFKSTSGRCPSRSRCLCSDSKSKPKSRPWRNSATLLIVAPVRNSLGFLIMTRSKKSKFMPGGVVFPGGVVSSADSSERWADLFKSSGLDLDLKNPKFLSLGAQIPFIYTDQPDDDSEPRVSISREVSLRITAIREMFEECGVLLCKPLGGTKMSSNSDTYQFDELRDEKQVVEWQGKSRNNAEEFLNLCEKISCVPDVNALGDWNNWLTPTMINSHSRYNTMFYMALLSKPLPFVIDNFEVENAKWETAETLLQEFKDKKLPLMPPQLYELTRLKDIQSLKDMKRLLEKRKQFGLGLTFPVFISVKDGIIILQRGDDMYPSNPDIYNSKEKEVWPTTIEESRRSVKNLHRAEIKDGSVIYVVNNVRYGHFYT